MSYDITIIGGGIVGLATAYQISQIDSNIKICILEKEAKLGQHQTGNNSGVIHSGVYYKPGSLKADNCKKGYKLLLDFCAEHNIPYNLCGKVIVATKESEFPQLDEIYKRGIQNGLKDLEILNAQQLRNKEPNVNGLKGIWVPQAGVIDYTLIARKYASLLEKKGATIKLNHKVLDIAINKEVVIKTTHGDIISKTAINCAGLYSDKIAEISGAEINHKILPFRGEYYKLKKGKEHLVNGLIYPVPNPEFPFLGVHFTITPYGGVDIGPNAVLAFKREGYKNTQINIKELAETLVYPGFHKIAAKYWKDGLHEMHRSFSKRAFVKAMKTLIPSVTGSDVVKAGAGVRAQACYRDGKLMDDFCILENNNFINVCNAPSPAATSSLAIGSTIAKMAINNLSTT